jgi:capsular polysaccharide biosynthesis protein
MELREYGAALRRHWGTAVGLALVCVLAAIAVVLLTPPTYRATAQVFVASTGEGTSGSQFVNQRVTSYPDVARSRAVLDPVIEDLGLTESFADLRLRVEATNPVETSQIDIAVTGRDAARAAEVANAVAEEFGVVVEQLERPQGRSSPVDLTVTNPATVPTTPDSPQAALLLALGVVVGLALGGAAAVVRSRLDTTVHTADDIRGAWGAADAVPVLARPAGRARRSALVGRPAAVLARRLEPLAETQTAAVLVLSPSPEPALAPESFVADVAEQLRGAGVTAVAEPTPRDAGDDRARVRLAVGSPLVSLRAWRRVAEVYDVVVVVVAPGRVQRAELAELRSVLTGAGISPLALVLAPAGRRITRSAEALVRTPTSAASPQPALR